MHTAKINTLRPLILLTKLHKEWYYVYFLTFSPSPHTTHDTHRGHVYGFSVADGDKAPPAQNVWKDWQHTMQVTIWGERGRGRERERERERESACVCVCQCMRITST